MKILFLNSWMHFKNENALINYKNIQFTIIREIHEIDNHDLNEFDCVFSPSEPIDITKYPNTKFIFGPHFSIFPDYKLEKIKGPKVVYNLLSDSIINIWKLFPICENLKLMPVPFGIETSKFINNKSINERKQVFIYFKERDINELKIIQNYMDSKNINYKLFNYGEKYSEDDYLNFLKEAKYGIWIGRHESQGFALQEALSCDVPLLVWNVKSMNQQYGSNYGEFEATTIPYWDNKCGEYFYDFEEFEILHSKLLNNIENYKPREFILENLSMEVCENKLIELINNL